jgi:surfeit locus 1 family protein
MPKAEANQPQRRTLVWPAVTALACFILFVSLGLWQLERRAWKEALIAQIDARANASPTPLPNAADWPLLAPQDYEYRHVALSGTFEHGKEALVFRTAPNDKGGTQGPGYLVLTPLRLASGAYVIVNRGFVPLDLKDPQKRAAGQVEGEVQITGLMRPPEPRNLFTPADNPDKGQYFTRDPVLIAQHFALGRAAPFSIDADDLPVHGGWPRGGATVTAIPNNHLSYALTWFGLAAALVGFCAIFFWRMLRGRPKASKA